MPERAASAVTKPVPAARVAASRVLVVLVGAPILMMLAGEPLATWGPAASPSSASWLSLREETRCEAMLDDYCLGRYGFTVNDDGSFIAGPSPRGTRTGGRITPQELKRLRELIAQFSATISTESRACEPEGLPGIKDQVEITFSDGRVVLIYDLGGRIGQACYVGSRDRVRDLHQYLHGLLAEYYPVPFPTH